MISIQTQQRLIRYREQRRRDIKMEVYGIIGFLSTCGVVGFIMGKILGI